MKMTERKDVKRNQDRIEGNSIILDGEGEFPKRVIILDRAGRTKEYRIIKTRYGRFILNS